MCIYLATEAAYPLFAVEEIVLWFLLPHWGISQAWWKDVKGVSRLVDCEFYIPSRRTCSAGIEHLRTCCSLTGDPCLICAGTEADRMKCQRRLFVLDYKSSHTTTS